MRFPTAALFFLVGSFIFFMFWVFSSLLIGTVGDALGPGATALGSSEFDAMLVLMPYAFGTICAIFFVVGLLLLFVLEALADEPEMYWRR